MPEDLRDNDSNAVPEAPGPVKRPEDSPDTAERSLADALRISFRVLSVIMLFVVAGFLLTGFRGVDQAERGIVTLFGKIVGTVQPGFRYTWPYPIGDIETVKVTEKMLMIDDFWMHVPPGEKTKELSKIQSRSEGLRPGYDGALLTGDRYLLHIKLNCRYRIIDVQDWKRNIDNEAETVRAAVCDAAIRAAARRTAESLRGQELAAFKWNVLRDSQAALDALAAGIEIRAIEVPQEGVTWPLRARSAFEDVRNAATKMKRVIDQARADAAGLLGGTAGPAYKKLVGVSWDVAEPRDSSAAQSGPLIDQYEEAMEALRDAQAANLADDTDKHARQAARIWEEIETVLINEARGEAYGVIKDARAEAGAIVQRAQSFANRFERLLKQLPPDEKGRKLLLDRLWAEVQDEVLSVATTSKYYLTPANGKTIIRVGRSEDIDKKIRRTKMLQEKEKKEREQKEKRSIGWE